MPRPEHSRPYNPKVKKEIWPYGQGLTSLDARDQWTRRVTGSTRPRSVQFVCCGRAFIQPGRKQSAMKRGAWTFVDDWWVAAHRVRWIRIGETRREIDWSEFTTCPSTVTLQLHCVNLLYSLVLQLRSSREYSVRQRVARSVGKVHYTSVDRNAATALPGLVVQPVPTVVQQSRVFRQTALRAVGVYYTSVDRNAATPLRGIVVQPVPTVVQQSRVFRQTARRAVRLRSLLHVRRP